MNPYVVIAFLIALVVSYCGGVHNGHADGINEQTITDQKEFDRIALERADQKAKANEMWRDKANKILALQAERDNFKNKLGESHVKNMQVTNKLRDVNAAYSLRFAAEADGIGGGGCIGAGSSEGLGTSNASAAYCTLSREVDAALKSIVYDADTLRDDYILLYDWAHGKKPE